MSGAEPVGFDLTIQEESAAEEADAPEAAVPARRAGTRPKRGGDPGLAILLIASGSGADNVTALLEQAFEDRCSVASECGTVEGATIMRRQEHDICLLMEDDAGGDAIGFVRSCVEAGDRPVIVLASDADSELDLKAVEAGAADCIPANELTADALERAIRHALMREHVTARVARSRPSPRRSGSSTRYATPTIASSTMPATIFARRSP